MKEPIDLELRADGTYAVPGDVKPGRAMHWAYWVSGFFAGFLAGFAAFGAPPH